MRGKNSTVRKSYSEKESSGLSTGLTVRSDFEAGETMSDASFNQSGSAASGYTRQVKGKRSNSSASSKGYSFEVEG
jgi:hypothetical protein